jgi:phosphoglycolate phosphatase
MEQPIRLVVFDWDGTLMDSEAKIVASMRAAGNDLGLVSLDDRTLRNVIGLGLKEAIEMLYPHAVTETHRAFAG